MTPYCSRHKVRQGTPGTTQPRCIPRETYLPTLPTHPHDKTSLPQQNIIPISSILCNSVFVNPICDDDRRGEEKKGDSIPSVSNHQEESPPKKVERKREKRQTKKINKKKPHFHIHPSIHPFIQQRADRQTELITFPTSLTLEYLTIPYLYQRYHTSCTPFRQRQDKTRQKPGPTGPPTSLSSRVVRTNSTAYPIPPPG